jgi:hypothetical protein
LCLIFEINHNCKNSTGNYKTRPITLCQLIVAGHSQLVTPELCSVRSFFLVFVYFFEFDSNSAVAYLFYSFFVVCCGRGESRAVSKIDFGGIFVTLWLIRLLFLKL